MRACDSSSTLAGGEDGTTIVEALIATAMLVTVASGVAGLLTWSTRAVAVAGTETTAVWLAQQKLEQLCALEWMVDEGGVVRSDDSTSVAVDPMSNSGPGLRPSSPSSVDVNTPEYMEYVSGDGIWRGDGGPPPAGAAFVRRWSVVPLPGDPLNTLVITVSVRPLSEASRDSRAVSSGVTLVTARTRLLRAR
jgi:hypothetical protein